VEIVLRVAMAEASFALTLECNNDGIVSDASIAMMAMLTKSSVRVKAFALLLILILPIGLSYLTNDEVHS